MKPSWAVAVIEEAYSLIEANDDLITITEKGLIKAIEKALLDAERRGIESAAELADEAEYYHVADAIRTLPTEDRK